MTALQLRPRLLDGADRSAVSELIAHDPVVNCVLESRVFAVPDLAATRLGGQLWGLEQQLGALRSGQNPLRAAIYHGGNLIPLGRDVAALTTIAEVLGRYGRSCSSIVGTSDAVDAVWQVLSRSWGSARIVRSRQPFLVADRRAGVVADDAVRRVRISELNAFMPAAIAMFTEELQTSPLGNDAGAAYRSRVGELIGAGRSFARFDRRGRVEFKAEIGALGRHTAQIQGVWVRPDLRGRGLGTAAMAQVLNLSLQLAPSVSLYVNEYNVAAQRLYQRLGFRQTQTLSTVLF